MASISNATRTLMSGGFIKAGVALIAGIVGSALATQFARQNIVDLQMKGADAVYSLALAFSLLALAPRQYQGYARSFALGATVSGTIVALDEYGVLDASAV